MAQQTAVEWLVEQLARKHNEFQALTFYYEHKEEIEQAKQMEKEQIIEAIINNQNGLLRRKDIIDAEKYYNETYNL
jgi:hypothetical protein